MEAFLLSTGVIFLAELDHKSQFMALNIRNEVQSTHRAAGHHSGDRGGAAVAFALLGVLLIVQGVVG